MNTISLHTLNLFEDADQVVLQQLGTDITLEQVIEHCSIEAILLALMEKKDQIADPSVLRYFAATLMRTASFSHPDWLENYLVTCCEADNYSNRPLSDLHIASLKNFEHQALIAMTLKDAASAAWFVWMNLDNGGYLTTDAKQAFLQVWKDGHDKRPVLCATFSGIRQVGLRFSSKLDAVIDLACRSDERVALIGEHNIPVPILNILNKAGLEVALAALDPRASCSSYSQRCMEIVLTVWKRASNRPLGLFENYIDALEQLVGPSLSETAAEYVLRQLLENPEVFMASSLANHHA